MMLCQEIVASHPTNRLDSISGRWGAFGNTRYVAQELLMLRRGEFGNPVVLTACSWSPGAISNRQREQLCNIHRRHLGKGQNDE